MQQSKTIPLNLLRQFDLPDPLIEIEELKRGHINRTYVATWGVADKRKRYVHQVVNHRIFKDVPALIRNIVLVTETMKRQQLVGRLPADQRLLNFIRTRDGAYFIRDEDGEYWRTADYIEDTVTYDVCPNAEVAREAAAILGRFHRSMTDIDVGHVVDTIPRFHDGALRYQQFEEAVSSDAAGRRGECAQEIEFARARSAEGALLMAALDAEKIPRRVCHNDMKLNNILFSADGRRAVCLLDLDTCMPGTWLFDFGDLVRNTAVPCAEDEQNLESISVDTSLLTALCKGYLGECGEMLTDNERALMPVAPRVLALTLGVRFLTDHLNGDTYFRVGFPGHNMVRARAQFQVVRVLEHCEQLIVQSVHNVAQG